MSRSKTRKKSIKERPIKVKIDPALAAAWKKAIATFESAAAEGQRAWDLKYETVGAILQHDPPLYLAGGLSTAIDFVRRYLPGEDYRSVIRNVRTAQYASPDEEERYTTSKISAAIDWLEATHGKPATGRIPVDFGKLRIATKGGSIKFTDASVQQIRDATRVASRRATHGPSAASSVVKAVAALLPKEASEVTVHYADGRLTIGRVPVRLFVGVMRALSKAKVPLG